MTCSICFERFTSPVSLPCGHVFCRECIRRTVDSIKAASVHHFCPACRKPYNVVTIDPALIPPYLRPHIQPSIRPVFFDETAHSPPTTESSSSSSASSSASSQSVSSQSPSSHHASASAPTSSTSATTSALLSTSPPSTAPRKTTSDLGRAIAEADALRLSCTTWRRRAEVHAAANAGLLGFARAAKESALRMRAERDAARNCCQLLKRKLSEVIAPPPSEWSDSDADSPLHSIHSESAFADLDVQVRVATPPPRGLPVYVLQEQQKLKIASESSARSTSEPGSTEPSMFGPPIKRRRVSVCATDSELAASRKTSIASILAYPVPAGGGQ